MLPIIHPKAIQHLCQTDNIFQNIINLYGEPPNWQRAEGFETLARIILEQHVSLESALAAYNKLKGYIGIFSTENILKLTDDEMLACHISRQKRRYLRALATAIQSDELDLKTLSKLSESDAKTELKKILGIGEWTAKIYLMFCLQSPDIFPEGDIAAINTVKELKAVKTKEAVIKITENWIPYRTAATYLLWHYYLCKRGRKAVT